MPALEQTEGNGATTALVRSSCGSSPFLLYTLFPRQGGNLGTYHSFLTPETFSSGENLDLFLSPRGQIVLHSLMYLPGN